MYVLVSPLNGLLVNKLGSREYWHGLLQIVRDEGAHILLTFNEGNSPDCNDTLNSNDFLIYRHYRRRGFLHHRLRHHIWDRQRQSKCVLRLIELVDPYLDKAPYLLLSVHVRHNECAVSTLHWEEQAKACD